MSGLGCVGCVRYVVLCALYVFLRACMCVCWGGGGGAAQYRVYASFSYSKLTHFRRHKVKRTFY